MKLSEQILQKRADYLSNNLSYIPTDKELGIFTEWLGGFMRGDYIGVTGGTSSAKSQFTRNVFMFSPIAWAIKNKVNIKILWFGMEESEQEGKYYLLSWLLFKTFQVRYNIEHFEGVAKTMFDKDLPYLDKVEPYFDMFWSRIEFYDDIYTTEGIHTAVLKSAATRGKFYQGDVVLTDVAANTPYDRYIADDPNEFVIVVGDHFGLIEPSDGEKSDREAMVRMSRIFRNQFCKKLNYIGVGVVQQMLAMENLESIKAEMVYSSIQGFADCKTIARDMLTILGITNIHRYNISTAVTSQKEISGGKINIDRLGVGDYQRVVGILKRRFGIVNKRVMLGFDGAVGHFFGFNNEAEIEDYSRKIENFNDGYKV